MSKAKLTGDLERLRAEVSRIAASNPEARRTLDALIGDIEKKLEDPQADQDSSLVEKVRAEIADFEAEYPRTTAILNDIMVTLSNMGI